MKSIVSLHPRYVPSSAVTNTTYMCPYLGQAQQFKWLERLYPQLFQRVRTFVEKGSFQIIGGSWVEVTMRSLAPNFLPGPTMLVLGQHDTNMPSGEALCR